MSEENGFTRVAIVFDNGEKVERTLPYTLEKAKYNLDDTLRSPGMVLLKDVSGNVTYFDPAKVTHITLRGFGQYQHP